MANSFFGTFRGLGLDQAGFFEQRQGGIDDAGAGRVGAAGAGLDFPDDVVTVARLLLDQQQHDDAQFPAFEHAAPAAPFARSGFPAASEAGTA